MSRVSILIPSFNHAEFLPACLDSLLAQGFEDWKAIAIDDGSSDSSREILRRYKGPKMDVLANDTNLGTYGTLDRALKLSEGEYVAILNSDDVWSPEKLERQVAALDAHPEASYCYTLGGTINAEGVEQPEDIHATWPKREMQELVPFLLSENRILASSVVFRREAARFRPELRYSGDWVALLDASLHGPAVCLAEPLTFWRIHARNTFRRSPGQVAEEILVRQSILAKGESWSVRGISTGEISKGLGLCATHLSALLVLQGRITEARAVARFAAKKSPSRASLRRLLAVSLPAAMAHRQLWHSEEPLEPTPSPHLVEFGTP